MAIDTLTLPKGYSSSFGVSKEVRLASFAKNLKWDKRKFVVEVASSSSSDVSTGLKVFQHVHLSIQFTEITFIGSLPSCQDFNTYGNGQDAATVWEWTPEAEGNLERPAWSGNDPLSKLVNALISFEPLFALMKIGARQVLIK